VPLARNFYGLSRHIPEHAKRAIRQRCGFGCVVCGCSIVEYHHFEPEYKDAHAHTVGGITLLCPTCHSKEQAGIFSSELIKRANSAPSAKLHGFASDSLVLPAHSTPFIRLGKTAIYSVVALMLDDKVLLGVFPPEVPGAPARIFARLEDGNGVFFGIEDNILYLSSQLADASTNRGRLRVMDGGGLLVLDMRLNFDESIEICYLRVRVAGCVIEASAAGLAIQSSKRSGKFTLNLRSISGDVAVWIRSNGVALVGSGFNGSAFASYRWD
jgi:hypothetical protein